VIPGFRRLAAQIAERVGPEEFAALLAVLAIATGVILLIAVAGAG
jgi:hypothetical protein